MTDLAVYAPLGLAFILGLLMKQRRGRVAVSGLGVALVLWSVAALSGGFDDDPEGTAALLTLVYGVPLYAAAWAVAVGVGYMVSRFWGKRSPDVG